MDLPAFLQVGLALRSQAGIDTLERGLKLPRKASRRNSCAATRRTRCAARSSVC
jgi:hypothetical protein